MENTDFFCLYKKSPMLIPLMSRIFKLWTDVKREISDFCENFLAGEVRDLDSRLRGNDPRQSNAGARQLVGQAPAYKAEILCYQQLSYCL